jgi:hypothetical protein
MAGFVWQRTVVRDNWHNMCTDLCRWKDRIWLTYSRNTAHVSPDGGIVVLRTGDLARWEQAAFIKTGFDNRDPKLLPVGDRLYLFFADSFYTPVNGRIEQTVFTCMSYTTDGVNWSTPVRISPRNHWLWRVVHADGAFWCAEKGGTLLSSQDAVEWTKVSRIPHAPDDVEARQHDHCPTIEFNESDLFFRPDGELWCVSRTKLPDNTSIFYCSSPPYQDWEAVNLGTMIHCPVIREVGGGLYVAGRRDPKTPWLAQYPPAGNTGIFALEKGTVTPVLALPSDGDAAYPGLLELDNGHMLVSYYSQHAYLSGAVVAQQYVHPYLAEYRVGRTVANAAGNAGPCDIFLAEIDLQADYERRLV